MTLAVVNISKEFKITLPDIINSRFVALSGRLGTRRLPLPMYMSKYKVPAKTGSSLYTDAWINRHLGIKGSFLPLQKVAETTLQNQGDNMYYSNMDQIKPFKLHSRINAPLGIFKIQFGMKIAKFITIDFY